MNNIIIDYDSTFIKVESLDVLARLSKNNSNKVNNRIKEITNLGMEGKISFSEFRLGSPWNLPLLRFHPLSRRLSTFNCSKSWPKSDLNGQNGYFWDFTSKTLFSRHKNWDFGPGNPILVGDHSGDI